MATKSSEKFSYKSARIKVSGETLRFDGGYSTKVGCFLMSQRLDESLNYYEIKILDTGVAGCISVGLAPYDYPLDAQPGWRSGSVGFHADDGRLYQNPLPEGIMSERGKAVGPRCKTGDRMGCGIRKLSGDPLAQEDILFGGPQCKLEVYFTVNGVEVAATSMVVPDKADGLHPAVGMHSNGEAAQITVIPGMSSVYRDVTVDDFMLVDDAEEDWVKVHDVRVNGQIIEYIGHGVNIHDVGLAQAKTPLNTRSHYFEIEIVEPGQNCYIAIGLVHKNYPLHRHPGWNAGSIAYHADDGKIFLGRGQGIPFGPRCNRGDVMGCGIQFPFDYVGPMLSTSDDEDDDEDVEDPSPSAGLIKSAYDRNRDVDDVMAAMLRDIGFHPAIGGEIQDDVVLSEDEDDFLWHQYDGKLDDPMWPPPGRMGGWDFVIDDPARVGNVDRLLDDAWDRLDRDRGMLRGGLRGRMRGPLAPMIYGRKEKNMMVKVFFTRNGYLIGHHEVIMPKDGFYPAVGMLSPHEKIRVDLHPLSG